MRHEPKVGGGAFRNKAYAIATTLLMATGAFVTGAATLSILDDAEEIAETLVIEAKEAVEALASLEICTVLHRIEITVHCTEAAVGVPALLRSTQDGPQDTLIEVLGFDMSYVPGYGNHSWAKLAIHRLEPSNIPADASSGVKVSFRDTSLVVWTERMPPGPWSGSGSPHSDLILLEADMTTVDAAKAARQASGCGAGDDGDPGAGPADVFLDGNPETSGPTYHVEAKLSHRPVDGTRIGVRYASGCQDAFMEADVDGLPFSSTNPLDEIHLGLRLSGDFESSGNVELDWTSPVDRRVTFGSLQGEDAFEVGFNPLPASTELRLALANVSTPAYGCNRQGVPGGWCHMTGFQAKGSSPFPNVRLLRNGEPLAEAAKMPRVFSLSSSVFGCLTCDTVYAAGEYSGTPIGEEDGDQTPDLTIRYRDAEDYTIRAEKLPPWMRLEFQTRKPGPDPPPAAAEGCAVSDAPHPKDFQDLQFYFGAGGRSDGVGSVEVQRGATVLLTAINVLQANLQSGGKEAFGRLTLAPGGQITAAAGPLLVHADNGGVSAARTIVTSLTRWGDDEERYVLHMHAEDDQVAQSSIPVFLASLILEDGSFAGLASAKNLANLQVNFGDMGARGRLLSTFDPVTGGSLKVGMDILNLNFEQVFRIPWTCWTIPWLSQLLYSAGVDADVFIHQSSSNIGALNIEWNFKDRHYYLRLGMKPGAEPRQTSFSFYGTVLGDVTWKVAGIGVHIEQADVEFVMNHATATSFSFQKRLLMKGSVAGAPICGLDDVCFSRDDTVGLTEGICTSASKKIVVKVFEMETCYLGGTSEKDPSEACSEAFVEYRTRTASDGGEWFLVSPSEHMVYAPRAGGQAVACTPYPATTQFTFLPEAPWYKEAVTLEVEVEPHAEAPTASTTFWLDVGAGCTDPQTVWSLGATTYWVSYGLPDKFEGDARLCVQSMDVAGRFGPIVASPRFLVDRAPPRSVVAAVPPTTDPSWSVSWVSTDQGSGVRLVTVYEKSPGQDAWTVRATGGASGSFERVAGKDDANGLYCYRAVGEDLAGNVEEEVAAVQSCVAFGRVCEEDDLDCLDPCKQEEKPPECDPKPPELCPWPYVGVKPACDIAVDPPKQCVWPYVGVEPACVIPRDTCLPRWRDRAIDVEIHPIDLDLDMEWDPIDLRIDPGTLKWLPGLGRHVALSPEDDRLHFIHPDGTVDEHARWPGARPTHLAMDDRGVIYLAEAGLGRISIFEPDAFGNYRFDWWHYSGWEDALDPEWSGAPGINAVGRVRALDVTPIPAGDGSPYRLTVLSDTYRQIRLYDVTTPEAPTLSPWDVFELIVPPDLDVGDVRIDRPGRIYLEIEPRVQVCTQGLIIGPGVPIPLPRDPTSIVRLTIPRFDVDWDGWCGQNGWYRYDVATDMCKYRVDMEIVRMPGKIQGFEFDEATGILTTALDLDLSDPCLGATDAAFAPAGVPRNNNACGIQWRETRCGVADSPDWMWWSLDKALIAGWFYVPGWGCIPTGTGENLGGVDNLWNQWVGWVGGDGGDHGYGGDTGYGRDAAGGGGQRLSGLFRFHDASFERFNVDLDGEFWEDVWRTINDATPCCDGEAWDRWVRNPTNRTYVDADMALLGVDIADLELSMDGDFAYTLVRGANTLSKLDLATWNVTGIRFEDPPYAVEPAPEYGGGDPSRYFVVTKRPERVEVPDA